MKSGSLRELMSYTFILVGTSFMHGPLTHRDPKTSANYADTQSRYSKMVP